MQVRIYKKVQATGEWRVAFLYVCLPWVIGLLIGTVVVFNLSGNNLAIARSLPLARVSLLGVLLSFFMPFMISYFIMRFMRRGFLSIYLSLKAAALSFSFCYCAKCFGTAGWLLAPLLFVSDLICSYYLLLFAFNHLSKTTASKNVFIKYAFLSVLFGMFNYFVLSPFTASLF